MCRDSYHALWMALGEGLPRPSQAGSGLTGAGLPPWTQVQAQVWSDSTGLVWQHKNRLLPQDS